ncbi:cytokine-inducible SH2-containing protein-like [Sinocyclocheilus grahami]|uniref:Cytokine-inducible SH2-containing protein n=1 Tax=Sinocyclocheilus grahami TaxID=75366 RepID=A0A672NWY6_SINGR|nr:PREDICTED: cytokine-inducible SH2-containing protein-like [Sinocyclocheilus grahami]
MILCVQGPAHLQDTSDQMVRFPVVTFSSPHCIHATVTLWDPSKDFRSIANNFSYLDASGWYWGAISASEAHSVLQGASEGTFLIRDSSHPLYMLTLSVKTGRGPTNVRIEYSLGRFRLDSTSPAKSRLQSFPDVPSLVQHYVDSRNKGEEEKTEELDHVTSPAPKECAVLLKLKRPIHRPQAFPSLQHLTRLVINKHTTCTESLPLPRPLLKYLQDYPFQL